MERIQAARQLLHDVPGMRAADAFKVLRDGATLPGPQAASPDHPHLAPVMAELRALHAEIANLRGGVAGLRALLGFVAERHGHAPQSLGDLAPTGPVDRAVVWLAPTPLPAACQRPADLQPSLTRLLSDLDSRYTLLETRGDVVLLTPSGQPIRLVDPRTVAALVKQGQPVRYGRGLRLSASLPPAQEG